MERELLKIGITQGDPNGVGLELILRSFGDESLMKHFIPVLYGSPKSYVYHKKNLAAKGFETPNFHAIEKVEDAQPGRLNLIVTNNEPLEIKFGQATAEAGAEALKALDGCLVDAAGGKLDAIITAPLDKATVALNMPGFNGHTGYIASKLGAAHYAMMLICDDLRVALVTDHIPISAISENLTGSAIGSKINLLHESLRNDFAIPQPKIAVLGLNPHAGDSGLLGKEEQEIIAPEIKAAQDAGKLVYGPYPADAFFGGKKQRQFDAVLAMYHDQGLIPFKADAFYDGVNYTAGLPVVRTSPDHGTAYDIAGKGIASLNSFMNAIFDAIAIVRNRRDRETATSAFLPFAELKKERFRIDF